VNEFLSPSYDAIGDNATNHTEGELALYQGGMFYKGEPFGTEWIGYAFAYQVPYLLLCTFITGACLKYVRVEPMSSPTVPEKCPELGQDQDKSEDALDSEVVVDEGDVEAVVDNGEIAIPFTPVTLSFADVCYDVKASKGNETIRLVNNVYGMFESGRMCALMGSSGAGE
jgi:hypothetical protein